MGSWEGEARQSAVIKESAAALLAAVLAASEPEEARAVQPGEPPARLSALAAGEPTPSSPAGAGCGAGRWDVGAAPFGLALAWRQAAVVGTAAALRCAAAGAAGRRCGGGGCGGGCGGGGPSRERVDALLQMESVDGERRVVSEDEPLDGRMMGGSDIVARDSLVPNY